MADHVMFVEVRDLQTGDTLENALHFNQILSITLQRQGQSCKSGIPLYLDRGYGTYTEVADDDTMQFLKEAAKAKKGGQKNAPPGRGMPGTGTLTGPAVPQQQVATTN